MRQKKFIIVKDWSGKQIKIRIGWPFYHRDLLSKSDEKEGIDCYGGGRWDINPETKIITLYGSSDDFGKPKKEDIQKAIKNLDKHDWWQIKHIVEHACEEEFPNVSFDDINEYKFDIQY